MKMSVDGESCPCCDVVCVTLQFRSEDSSTRSVAGLRDFRALSWFAPVAELASRSLVSCLR